MTNDRKKKGFGLLVCAVLILSCCSCSGRNSTKDAAQSREPAQETRQEAAVAASQTAAVETRQEKTQEEAEEIAYEDALTPEVKLPDEEWQDQVMFPGWDGYTEDGPAENTTYSFSGRQGHGILHVRCSNRTESFRLFINGHPIDTEPIFRNPSTVFGPGGMLDLSPWAVDGENTVQVSDIQPDDEAEAVEILIHYPELPDETQAAQ